MQSSNKTLQKKAKSKFPKPYNNYNLFFILERTRLIEAKQSGATAISDETIRPSLHSTPTLPSAYGFIEIPPLPPRYEHLKSCLAENWYDPHRNKLVKRKHSKSHGMISFRVIARTVADNWKAVDPITKIFIEAVAALLKRRHQEMGEMGELSCFSVGAQLPMPMMPFPFSTSRQVVTEPAKFTKRAPPSPSRMEQRGKTVLLLAPQTSHLQQYEMESMKMKPVTATPSPATTMTQIYPQTSYQQTYYQETSDYQQANYQQQQPSYQQQLCYQQNPLQIEPDIILNPFEPDIILNPFEPDIILNPSTPNVSPNLMCLPVGGLLMDQVNYLNNGMGSMMHNTNMMCQDVHVSDTDILNTSESF